MEKFFIVAKGCYWGTTSEVGESLDLDDLTLADAREFAVNADVSRKVELEAQKRSCEENLVRAPEMIRSGAAHPDWGKRLRESIDQASEELKELEDGTIQSWQDWVEECQLGDWRILLAAGTYESDRFVVCVARPLVRVIDEPVSSCAREVT
jgi:hypothetical protein